MTNKKNNISINEKLKFFDKLEWLSPSLGDEPEKERRIIAIMAKPNEEGLIKEFFIADLLVSLSGKILSRIACLNKIQHEDYTMAAFTYFTEELVDHSFSHFESPSRNYEVLEKEVLEKFSEEDDCVAIVMLAYDLQAYKDLNYYEIIRFCLMGRYFEESGWALNGNGFAKEFMECFDVVKWMPFNIMRVMDKLRSRHITKENENGKKEETSIH